MTGDEKPNSVPFIAHLVVLMSPVCEPSMAPTMPIREVSRFSSPCDTITLVPLTTTPVLMARLAAMKLQTFSPVCGLIACTAPSPLPEMSSRSPLIVAMSRRGVVRVVRTAAWRRHVDDLARALVERDEAVLPGGERAPVRHGGADTMTRSPSMRGDAVRPPWVVKAANSSPTERCQRSLPSRLSAMTSAPHAQRVDVAGLGIGRR